MAKYLARICLDAEGVQLLRTETASGRRAAVAKFIGAAGGKLDGLYFAFGQEDVLLIIDLPDNVSAAAISLVNNSAGNVRAIYTPLITVEEMDQAIDKATTLASPNPER
jgi:uncharacterized protein with GYD domain